uniref:Uncharacterized protein n=1 Tax=Arundo donax TaxID=35708 RepID=A0A0A8YGX1_ARUDO
MAPLDQHLHSGSITFLDQTTLHNFLRNQHRSRQIRLHRYLAEHGSMIRNKSLELRNMEDVVNLTVCWKIQLVSYLTKFLQNSIRAKELER